MTDEQILELVRFHFQEGGLRDDGSCSEYFGTPENFIEFARAIYEIAYNEGHDEGWESHQESVYLNSSYPTDYDYD
jgi:hypothetical protein